MSDILITRDGLVGNSPRYTGGISPTYKRFLQDDTGAAINLTGISTNNLSITFVNQSNPLIALNGSGTWSILNATTGEVSYQYGVADLATAGNWFVFVTCQLIGEPAPRVFDPDLLSVFTMPTGDTPVVTIQSVNLSEINGATPSSSNALPVSVADGSDATLGSVSDTAYSGSGNGTAIALLKKLVAQTAAMTVSGTVTANAGSGNFMVAQATGTNLHAVVDSGSITANAGTNLNTSLLALESGGNLATIATRTPALGQAAMVASSPVVIASNQSAVPVSSPTSGTATLSNVAASATSVSILASNTSRKGAIIQNDSSSAMYLAYAATASTTAYTVKIPANTGFEMPITPVYTGAMSAVWDTATGSARITELS